jgi:hypothetical protein
MDHETIRTLLDKYWLAETTVEEEKALAAYFRGPDIDPRLEPFRHLFAYFEEEAKITTGEDFESRILERLLREERATAVPPRRWLNTSYAAAAAVILAIGAYLMYSPAPYSPSVSGPATTGTTVATGNVATGGVKDTYDDPQQALAAIRHALLTASARMNQGRELTQKNMDRLSGTWQKTIKL